MEVEEVVMEEEEEEENEGERRINIMMEDK